ncbi:GNAT family N-acetyltransferase [Tsukamurella sp. 8F]|uniref:GNAT family N-acetyltransferase n=1 Tax=unclassified Tsukamurella TaxID=2633480 RepID=UPI0023B94EEC|nr:MULTISPECIES: GNAT family N-acetyltransferase [unclassified Tsukamurella]MDF0530254.1 GNAT family N-acetyltransferase [Tsukamurella sp. 8J]MDF0586571.1 GNAT family N-acetyltransferase [Tsukamurella sp. 8F]
MISFRRVTREDFPLLSAWLAEPHNRRWWNHDPDTVEADFAAAVDGREPSEDWLALDDGVPFGLLQRQRWVDYPDEARTLEPVVTPGARDYGIDYLIGRASATGRGMGTEMISAFCLLTFGELDADAVIVAVAAGNRRSWRALERAGFTRVGEVDMSPDNPIDPPDHVVDQLRR